MKTISDNYFKQPKFSFDILQLLSKYRTTLMGIAMLWVVLHHCNCNTHYDLNFLYSFPLLNLGYSGVDIFIFLSGFGIFYSLTKNSDIGNFLMKRIHRFLPAIPIFIIYIIYSKICSFHEIVGYFTLENFWISNGFLGYLSYAFFFYLLSPLIKNIIDNHVMDDLFKLFGFLFVLFTLTIPYWKTGQLVGISRILIFTFGMYLGYYFCNNIKFNKYFLYYTFFFMIFGFITLIIVFLKFVNIRHEYGLIWYPELLFIPGLCFCFTILFSFLEKYCSYILNMLNTIGKYSLTIYCIDFFITTCVKLQTFWIHFCLSLLLGIAYGLFYERTKKYLIRCMQNTRFSV